MAHVPDLVRLGSKPSRDIPIEPNVLDMIHRHLRDFDDAVAYPPHQVFIGNMRPDDLKDVPKPWFDNLAGDAKRTGPFGEVMPQAEFYGLMKMCDQFDLMLLEEDFLEEARTAMSAHPLITKEDLDNLGKPTPISEIEKAINEEDALPPLHG